MKITVEEPKTPNEVLVKDMSYGQIGVLVDGGTETIVMRSPNGLISLSDATTWGIMCSFKIKLLPKGTRVILEVE